MYPIKNIEKKKTESEKEALYGREDRKARKNNRHDDYGEPGKIKANID